MRLIGLAGPSCSGKSTIAKELEREGIVRRLRMDDFYVDKENAHRENGKYNWEHPKNISFGELYSALKQLKEDKTIICPIYDKTEFLRVDKRLIIPDRPILCEGFLLYTDEKVRNILDHKFYITVDEEEQYRRRKKRQPSLDDEYFWEKVVGEYKKYGEQTMEYADRIIESGDIEEIKREVITALKY